MKTLEWVQVEVIDVELWAKLYCRCPVNGRQDQAIVQITYRPVYRLLELESFGEYCRTHFADEAITHEAVTLQLAADLNELLAPSQVTIETEWEPVEGVNCRVRHYPWRG